MTNDTNAKPASLNIHQIITSWRCEKCNETSEASVACWPESGVPICPECGDDMALQEEVRHVQ